MKKLIFASGFVFVLAPCGVYGQAVTQAQSAPATSPGPVFRVEPLPNAGGADKKVCGEDVPLAFRPPPAIQGRCLAVKEYMRYKSPISPIGDLVLATMGDETAFYLHGIIGAMSPLTAEQTLTVLDIIHNSFKMPAAIPSAGRKPEKSLALLKNIQATAVDQIVKERIAAETIFLTTLPQTITRIPLSNLPVKPGAMPNQEDFK